VQLCTKPEYYDYLIQVAKTPRRLSLSDAALETLSIVAYKQPVTRLEVERIRGVNCDHALNRLLEYDLITELGRLDAPGRPLLFGTTETFLRCFGLESIRDLPEASPVPEQLTLPEELPAEAASEETSPEEVTQA
jgi:segregation and condensation protein B